MLEGETDFKKMYREHVQEHIDLKKHVNSLEAAKMKKIQEISHSQNSFLRKYNKYVDGSLHPSKRKTTGLNTPTSIPNTPSPGGRRKSLGDISVTKNLGASMPVDSPYSLESWHTLVNNGCRDSAGRDPLEMIREQLVREPVPQLLSLDEENMRVSDHTSNKDKEVPGTVKRRLSRDMTSLDGTSLNQTKIIKKQSSRRCSLDISDHRPLLRREQTDIPKSCLNKSPPTERKPQNKRVTIIEGANNTEHNLTTETTKVKLPSIGPVSPLRKHSDSDVDDWESSNAPPSTPASWSGMTPRLLRRGRSNSLAPGMLQSFQERKSFNRNSSIEEQDETTRHVRSNSFGEIDRIRNRLSSTIKETASMGKATLQIMVENSKGLNKFKYLAKMVNVGLKEMKEKDKENSEHAQTCSEEDIVACRYLRIPRGSISADTGETNIP